MSGEKIQVRAGWWRQRCGNVVRIAGESGDAYYPWRCAAGGKYRNNGRYFTYGLTELDLVEFLGKNITITEQIEHAATILLASAKWSDRLNNPKKLDR